MASNLTIVFKAQFQGKVIELPEIDQSSTVRDLKLLLQVSTRVPIERQKLIGLVKGKLPTDDTTLKDLISGGHLKVLTCDREYPRFLITRIINITDLNILFKGPPFQFTLMGTPVDKAVLEPAYKHSALEAINGLFFSFSFSLFYFIILMKFSII